MLIVLATLFTGVGDQACGTASHSLKYSFSRARNLREDASVLHRKVQRQLQRRQIHEYRHAAHLAEQLAFLAELVTFPRWQQA